MAPNQNPTGQRPNPKRWNDAYDRLIEHLQTNGGIRPAQLERDSEGWRIGKWVQNQAQRHRYPGYPPDRAERLEALPGWTWKVVRGARPVVVQAPPTSRPLRGTAELVAFLRANTADLATHLPRHPWHPHLREQLLALRRERAQMNPVDAALLETVPGWTWQDRSPYATAYPPAPAYPSAARPGAHAPAQAARPVQAA